METCQPPQTHKPDTPVLLIDDDPDVTELFSRAAGDLDIPLVCKPSGEEALQWLLEHPAQLMYVDYRLPGMTGTEFIRKAGEVRPPLPPFILITGLGNEEVAMEAQQLGVLDYVVKNGNYLDRIPILLQNGVRQAGAASQMSQMRKELQLILDTIGDAVYGVDEQGRATFVNPAMEALLGWKAHELIGRPIHAMIHHTRPEGGAFPGEECPLNQAYREGRCYRSNELVFFHKDGHGIAVACNSAPRIENGRVIGAIVIFHDISEWRGAQQAREAHIAQLEALNRKLEEAQNQLLQSEKMASVGLLAAGVAHEINNPVGYVQTNLGSLKRYLADLFQVLDAYEQAERDHPACAPDCFAQVREVKERVDLDFLRSDLAGLMDETQEGISRVKKVVQDLKDFSHVGAQEEWQEADIHRSLDSTLNVVWNELKYKARVVKEYGTLLEIRCIPSQLNQVFMNLLVNAAQAIEDKGTITIRTGILDNGEEIWVEIEDDGQGIPAENLKNIFDPFFTTKPVGKGTGLGLSVSYGIIEKHGGRIQVDSTEGKGTRFRIWLPVAGPRDGNPAPGKPS